MSADNGSFKELNIGGVLYKPIVVSNSQPQGSGIFWAQPTGTTQTAQATMATPQSRQDSTSGFNAAYGVQANPHTYTMGAPVDALTGAAHGQTQNVSQCTLYYIP